MAITPSAELELLEKFVGTWNTSGRILATETGPEVMISGTDKYEWLPGGFFLLHQVNVNMGAEKNETIEIIGYDMNSRQYSMQHYDNEGNSGTMWATVADGVWTYTGENLRFSGGFKDSDREFPEYGSNGRRRVTGGILWILN